MRSRGVLFVLTFVLAAGPSLCCCTVGSALRFVQSFAATQADDSCPCCQHTPAPQPEPCHCPAVERLLVVATPPAAAPAPVEAAWIDLLPAADAHLPALQAYRLRAAEQAPLVPPPRLVRTLMCVLTC